MRFDLFDNVKAKTGVPCTPQALADKVNSDAYLQAVKELQAATDEAAERRAKSRLPVVTYNASFEGRERNNANAIPSGLFFTDYDGIDDPRRLYNEKICGRCDELGILRVEVSIRQHGLHLITECQPGLKTIAANQRWLDDQLGLQCDRACKDLARASYVVPESFVLYERGALWHGMPKMVVENPAFERESQPKTTKPVETQNLASPNDETSSDETQNFASLQRDAVIARLETIPYNPDEKFGEILYADILHQFWKMELGRAEPLKGERHASLMSWARQVCYFTDFDLELMKRVTPTLGISEHELAEIICDTLRWRHDHKSPVTPSKLKGIIRGMETVQRANSQQLTANGQQPTANSQQPTAGVDEVDDISFLKRLPPLPKALQKTVDSVPDKAKMPTICALMTLLMAYATRVKVRYCDGRWMRLNGMCIVYGDQASGKSLVIDVIDRWKQPMREADKEARQREDEFKRIRKNRKANEKLPDEPTGVIRDVPITISCSTLLKRQKNAGGLHLYSDGEELDTLRKTNGAGSWSAKYDVYRLAYDNGWWGQDYNSDQAESGMVRVAYNWCALGTLGSVRKCFKADNIENGMCGRVMFAKMPSRKFEHMPTYKELPQLDDAVIREAVHILESAEGELELPRLCKTIQKWCDQLADEASFSEDVVVDTFRKRSAVNAFRCAVVFQILDSEGDAGRLTQESDYCQQFAEVLADYILHNQCDLFGVQVIENLKSVSVQYHTGNKVLFDELPTEFNFKHLEAMRPDAKRNTLRKMVSRWVGSGWVVPRKGKGWSKIVNLEM